MPNSCVRGSQCKRSLRRSRSLASSRARAAKTLSSIIENRRAASELAIISSIVCGPEMTFWLFWLRTTCRIESRSDGIVFSVCATTLTAVEPPLNCFVRQRPEREVELSPQRLPVVRIEAPLLHVPDHADDLPRVPVVVELDSPADRVFVREIFAGEDLVNHRDGLSPLVVLLGEEAAAA